MNYIIDAFKDISIPLGLVICNRKSKMKYLHYAAFTGILLLTVIELSKKIKTKYSNKQQEKERKKMAEKFEEQRLLKERKEELQRKIQAIDLLLEGETEDKR